MQTERITILATPEAKRAIAARARARGLSIGEYARRRFDEDEDMTPEQEAEMAALVRQANDAVPQMNAAIDHMRAKLQATHGEVDCLLRAMGAR